MRSESNAIRSPSRSSTLRPATSTRCAPCPNRVSIWFFSYHSGGRMNLGSCSSPRRYSLDSGGRSYGGWGSWPISTTPPSKPSSRSVAAAVPPAILAPMTRKVGTGLLQRDEQPAVLLARLEHVDGLGGGAVHDLAGGDV